MPSSNDQYQKTLEFLYGQLPMFQRIGPAAFKKDLSNIRLGECLVLLADLMDVRCLDQRC